MIGFLMVLCWRHIEKWTKYPDYRPNFIATNQIVDKTSQKVDGMAL